jgi:hypothetical protein
MSRREDNTDQKHASNTMENKMLNHLLLKRLSDRDAKFVFVDMSCRKCVQRRLTEIAFISPQYHTLCVKVPAFYSVVCVCVCVCVCARARDSTSNLWKINYVTTYARFSYTWCPDQNHFTHNTIHISRLPCFIFLHFVNFMPFPCQHMQLISFHSTSPNTYNTARNDQFGEDAW